MERNVEPSHATIASGYRADIDGLRAVAVLPVVLFHYGYTTFSGGFIGVDIFFVISGYLITSIITSEIECGTFTIQGFYERRIRRILPALFCVLTVVTTATAWLLTPLDMVRYGAELWHSSIFSTNFLFYKKDGYFDGVSSMRLLLHSWSLSIEEQFYIIMPVFLMWWVRRFRQSLTMILCAALITSLLISIISVRYFPSFAFYLLPARAWELLCGSVLAVGVISPDNRRRVREVAAACGLFLIGIAVFCYSSVTPFPGAAAVLPCLGATLLIWSSTGQAPTTVSRVLSREPFVAIGKISYSLYLWHWPLLVLMKYYLLRDLMETERLIAIGVALLLSTLTYFLVEQPFRRKRALVTRRKLFTTSFALLVVIFALGSAAKATGGFPARLSTEARQYAVMAASMDPRHNACNVSPSLDKVRRGDICEYGAAHQGAPDFAIWGDSHAGAMMPAFQALALDHDLWGLNLSFGSCPPLLGVGVIRTMERGQINCPEYNQAAVDLVVGKGVKAVILVARWPMYTEKFPRVGVEAQANGPLILTDDAESEVDERNNRSVLGRGLDRTLSYLNSRGIRVYVMEPVPEALVDVPSALAMNTLLNRPADRLAPDRAFTQTRQAWIHDRFAAAEAHRQVVLIRTLPLLCAAERCLIEVNGRPLYRDSNHLSVPGALFLKPAFEPLFNELNVSDVR